MKIADPQQMEKLKSCRALGPVQVGGSNPSEATVGLKNKTAELGGNVVLSRLQFEKTACGDFGCVHEAKGQAYACPDDVTGQLISSDTY